MPAYKMFGSGPCKVLALHNWFCDSSIYEPLLSYLDPSHFTFLFLDLRGYGVAKELKGDYSLQESVEDAIGLVRSQNWTTFHMVSHAMGTFIAQKIAIEYQSLVKKMVVISPIPASGLKKGEETVTFLEEAALHNTEGALECVQILTNRRYSPYITHKFVTKWQETSCQEARLAYLHLLMNNSFINQARGLSTPILAIFGEHDIENDQNTSQKTLSLLYPNLQIHTCKNVGHFPLQESPMQLASWISTFLS